MLLASCSPKFLAASQMLNAPPMTWFPVCMSSYQFCSLHDKKVMKLMMECPGEWKASFLGVWCVRWSKSFPKKHRFGWTVVTSPYMTVSEVIFRKDIVFFCLAGECSCFQPASSPQSAPVNIIPINWCRSAPQWTTDPWWMGMSQGHPKIIRAVTGICWAGL